MGSWWWLRFEIKMFNRIQKIGSVVGSNNLIINGDVVVNDDILPTIAAHLLRPDFEQLSQEAKKEMKVDIDECVQKVLEQVLEKKLEDKLTEFSRPSTQWAFYSTLKGYTIAETLEQREMIVDSMIERIQENWDSTERLIIDTALEILPRLTPSTLSSLGLLQLRHQMYITPVGVMLDQHFKSLTPLVEQMAGIGTLELEYLKQEKLILPLGGIRKALTLEQNLLSNYDLFFRMPLAEGVYDAYCRLHPEAHEAITDVPIKACMMWCDGTKNNQTAFCCPNSRLLKKTLMERHQEYIIPHVDELMKMMPAYTEDEVRAYFFSLTPAWERLFKLFSSDELTKSTLSITGTYIGGKILAKACHGTPLALSNYNKMEAI